MTEEEIAHLQAEHAAVKTQLAATTAERDTFAGKVKDFEQVRTERDVLAGKVKDYDVVRTERDTIKTERDKFAADVDGYVKRDREAAIVTGLQAKVPGLDSFQAAAAVAKLAEEGHIDRHAEKPDDQINKAVEVLKTRSPGMTTPRQASGGGGDHGKQPITSKQSSSLIR